MKKRIAGIVLTVTILLTLSGITNYRAIRDKQQELIMRIRARSIDQPEYVFWVGRDDYGILRNMTLYYKRPHNPTIRYFQAGNELR